MWGLTVCSDSTNYAGRTPPPPRSSTPSTMIEHDGDDLRSNPFLERKGELNGRFLKRFDLLARFDPRVLRQHGRRYHCR